MTTLNYYKSLAEPLSSLTEPLGSTDPILKIATLMSCIIY